MAKRRRLPIPSHRRTNHLISLGYRRVVGIDEVGRGSLAGPVTAAAVILEPPVRLPGVRDSKLLKPHQREQLCGLIKRRAQAIGLGWATPAEVDRFGLTWAVRQSGLRALTNLGSSFDAVILDGKHNYLGGECYAVTIIKADQSCLNVAAASIIAKVARDRLMARLARLYPELGWETNRGYGTRGHHAGLAAGITPWHRRRYKPIQRLLQPGLGL